MKSPEEIKLMLEHCSREGIIACDGCSYFGKDCLHEQNHKDALAYIQQLERERDAAVKRLKDFSCNTCKYEVVAVNAEPCHICFNNNKWEFDGVQEVE